MVKVEKSTAISTGSEEITGSKFVRSVYKKPTASVQIPKKITVNLEDDVAKIFFQTHFIYKEATTKKDKPHFTQIIKLNGKEVGRATWSDPDVYNKFEEHDGFLQVEIDLKKFYLQGEKRLEFEIHLECWLEEQEWKGGEIKETISAYDSGKIIVNLGSYTPPGPEPEISLKIFPTHSPGEDKYNYVNTDWGEPYRLELSLNNKTDFVLEKSNSFELFEDGLRKETATLGNNLDPKQKTIIQTVKKAKTKATWEIQKDNSQENKNTIDYFEWYKDIGGGEFGVKQKNKIYKYYATGYVEASNAGPWDLKTDEISVNVRVPDYKINAMNTYNLAVKLERAGVLASGILGILIGLKRPIEGGGGSIATGIKVSELASEVKNEMEAVMDDPPKFDRNYKKIFLPKVSKGTKHKNKLLNNYILSAIKFRKYSKAMRITSNRLYSAELKFNKKIIKKQKTAKLKYKNVMCRALLTLSKIHIKISADIIIKLRKVKNLNVLKSCKKLAIVHRNFGKSLKNFAGSLI